MLDYNYFKDYYKVIAIVLGKQQSLDADPKAMQQINFAGNLERDGNENTAMSFLIEGAKKPFQVFTWNCKNILIFLFALI